MKPRLRRLRDVFLRQVVLSNATSVPCVSASVAEANIGRGWSTKRRVSVVYDGFHLLDNQSANRATPVRVGHIGRFHESKNQDFLAKVYAELVARRSDVHCTMTGKPDAEIFPRVQAILSKEIADGRVALHPQTDRIADVISSCDLMVSTSAYEGLPGAIIESLSGGVPVVASAIAPSMEIARQNEHVTIVKGWDPKHWAEVIDSTLNELLGLNKQETVSRIQKSVLTGPFYYEASDNSIIELYNAG